MADGASANVNLRKPWSRIVFNLLVSNTDVHSGRGWALSPVFDMNPIAHAHGLKLNISEADSAMDLELARSVAAYVRVSIEQADVIILNQIHVVSQWRPIANSLSISNREQQ